MKLSEFNYKLPKELIAQYPLKDRDKARLMVLNRAEKSITEKSFKDIIEYIQEGDALVLNNTRVLPVRFYGKRKTGAKVEIFLLNVRPDNMRALVRPSKRIKEGEKITLDNNNICVTVLEKSGAVRFVKFDIPIEEIFKKGHTPLPPYITREDTLEDTTSYQTVYAAKDGATAAPTAGLHFTKELIDKIREKGVQIVFVTLHTSYGTFSPVTVEEIENHVMHSEYFEITKEAAEAINKTKLSDKRVFAVGTTSARVLETAAIESGSLRDLSGETNLFIYPGYKFKIVDSLITNFHFPKSTLLMLISAFGEKSFIFKAYEEAIRKGFRFFSYGDAMLIV